MFAYEADQMMNDEPDSKLKVLFASWSNAPQMLTQQGAWWACVLLMGWTGPALMFAFVIVHLAIVRAQWRHEAILVIASTAIGLALDNALAWSGSVTYVGDLLIGYCPLWLAAIWAGFGATLRHSQQVLVRSLPIALATGFAGGPLAYLGGEKLERLTVNGLEGWLAVSLLWGVALFLLYQLVAYVNRSTDG